MQMMLNKAIVLAANHHDGQFDVGGKPYLLHVLRVMSFLSSEDEELNCIAVLHDIVEDTSVTLEALEEAGFSERVIKGVKTLSKNHYPVDVDYQEYVMAVGENPDTRKVKMADLRHNMDIRRLKGVSEKDMKRMAKYTKAYDYLQKLGD